jgi:hypothetical protein
MATVPAIKIPTSPFVDAKGNISREWRQWLLNPQFLSLNIIGVLGVESGGTGLGTLPGAGQLLIGNGSGYTLAALSGDPSSITITSGLGSIGIAISNVYAGQTSISTLGTILAGTWEASIIDAPFGGTGMSSYTVGDLLYASDTDTLSGLADVAIGNALISGGVNTPPAWGKIGLATHVTGNLPVGNLDNGTGATSATFWRGDGTWTNPLPQPLSTTDNVTFNQLTVTASFGCNGASPQASAAVNAAISATAGATYTAVEQGMLNDLKALVNQLRGALIANGIAM